MQWLVPSQIQSIFVLVAWSEVVLLQPNAALYSRDFDNSSHLGMTAARAKCSFLAVSMSEHVQCVTNCVSFAVFFTFRFATLYATTETLEHEIATQQSPNTALQKYRIILFLFNMKQKLRAVEMNRQCCYPFLNLF